MNQRFMGSDEEEQPPERQEMDQGSHNVLGCSRGVETVGTQVWLTWAISASLWDGNTQHLRNRACLSASPNTCCWGAQSWGPRVSEQGTAHPPHGGGQSALARCCQPKVVPSLP